MNHDDITDRYNTAQNLMQGVLSNRVAMNDAVFPHWIGDSQCFWYIRETKEGKQFRLVDAKEGSNAEAFDHKVLADRLSSVTGKSIDHQNLPISKNFNLTLSPLNIRFQALGENWLYDPIKNNLIKCHAAINCGLHSPDNRMAVFIRDYNLWVRDKKSGKELALTFDGMADYAYSVGLFDYIFGEGEPQVLWAPDSKRLFTYQLDTRKVISRPYVQYVPEDGSIHPNLVQTKMSFPGDKNVESFRLVVINVETGELTPVDYPALAFSGYGRGGIESTPMGWWSNDSKRAFFVDVSRGAKTVRVVELDSLSGITRVLFEESSDTFVKLCHTSEDTPIFLPLPESDELIWFSERSGWGHLYLYDLKTGQLKHSISEGDWLVRELLHFDIKNREILVQTAGRRKNINPYYCDICKINIDSGELISLVSGCFEYRIYQPHTPTVYIRNVLGVDSPGVNGVSFGGQYLVTTFSRVNTKPVSILIDRNGNEILTLETADVSGLPSGWHWPEPLKLQAADGKTDIYATIYRPPGFSTENSYPVIDFSSSTRSLSTVPQGSFINGAQFDYNYLLASALSALGFIVVVMDARGTPLRNKAFQDHLYGEISATSDFNDRISCLKQLSKKYSYMDLERVGISGSDVIPTPVYGLLNHPEFYKVAVVHCFLDPRYNFASYGEIYDGIPTDIGEPMHKPRYADDYIESLKGKLLLITGMLEYATPASTFRLIEALQKANKNFDVLCLPNLNTNMSSYPLRRNWDYLVTHLQGLEPPHEFNLTTSLDWLIEVSELPNLGSC